MTRAKSQEAGSRAQQLFRASEQREATVRAEIEKERAAVQAKTVRLKALRLAKEANDREIAAANPPAVAAKSRRPARKAPKS